jgi:hypothetical protein
MYLTPNHPQRGEKVDTIAKIAVYDLLEVG